MEVKSLRKRLNDGAQALAEKAGNYIRHYVSAPEEAPSRSRESDLNRIVRGAGYLCGAFLIAGASLGGGASAYCRPLGAALLVSAERGVIWTYAGLVLSVIVKGGNLSLAYLFAYTAALVLRIILCRSLSVKERRQKLFGEPFALRAAVGCAAAFSVGIYRMIAGGFLLDDLGLTLIELAVTPAAAFIFNGALSPVKRFTVHYEAGTAALIACGVWALRGADIFGFSLCAFAAFIATLYVSKTGGVLRGGVIGLLCGLAYSPSLSPAFAFAGLASGLLWGVSSVVAVAAACITGIAYGAYQNGFAVFYSFAPDLVASSALFTPFVQFGLLPKLLIYSSSTSLPNDAVSAASVSAYKEKAANERLESLSDAMSCLSEVFYALSDRLRRPGIFETRQLCDRTCRTYCDKCPMNTLCWSSEYSSTVDAMNKLTRGIVTNGCAREEDVPAYFRERCRFMEKILSELNLAHAEQLEAAARTDKTEVFALDYEALAKLLTGACEANCAEFEIDCALSERLRKRARMINLCASSVCAYGKRRRLIVAGGLDLSKVRLSAREIKRSFSEVCGIPLSEPEFSVDSDYITMTLHAAPVISAECAKASISKQNERINGDSVTSFSNREDYFYALICDGMGSGREAALTSRVTSIFLEKLLGAGNAKSTVLEMLNNFIRSKNLECFSTVDLLEIDLLGKKAGFIKSGAAPSFILRDGKLFRITSNSLPVGITREINAEEIKFELEPEDIIVMISDGIAQCFEDSLWLAELLTYGWEDEAPVDGMSGKKISLDAMANKILAGAAENNPRSDDMTVALIRIKSAADAEKEEDAA